MIISMTAFARTETAIEDCQLVWEIRSVNHRYLDINLRLPDEFRQLDSKCRQAIAAFLNRGRIDATLKFEKSPGSSTAGIDLDAVNALAAMIAQIEQVHPGLQPARSTDILRWPGVILDSDIETENLLEHCTASLKQTLQQLVDDRKREGERLGELMEDKIRACQEIRSELASNIPEIQRQIQEKWNRKIDDISASMDPERVAQEIAIILTRSDVVEELDRLETHLDETLSLLNSDKPVGRRMDFLMQELNREANTLGSKSIDERMTNASIELKVLIDQVREQVQNIE